MKTIRIYGILLIAVLLIVLQQSGFSQDIISAEDFNPKDVDESGKLISTYKEFYKNDLYEMAQESWLTVFNEFPDASEKLYVDGVSMYRHFIAETPEGQAREDKIDTLMLIYDQRMANFGGEGNVLGRKGSDLLRYRSSDKEEVLAAYGMLGESLEIQGTTSREPVVLNYISSALILHDAAMIDVSQAEQDYFLVTGLMEEMKGSSSRRDRTRASVDEMVKKAGILSCEGLDNYFGPQLMQNMEDPDLFEKVINTYTFAGCKQSDLYALASESLYDINPDAESAHELAMFFISKNDLEKAAFYLNMAVQDESLGNETRAERFYELSIVSLARGENCEAINFAREANAYRNDYGKAYIALGDAFIASRKQLGDDFQQQTAYWAAADMYQAAARMDPSLSEEANEKLSISTTQYPNKEDIFFQDLKVGNSYLVGGCIQENTAVKSRD